MPVPDITVEIQDFGALNKALSSFVTVRVKITALDFKGSVTMAYSCDAATGPDPDLSKTSEVLFVDSEKPPRITEIQMAAISGQIVEFTAEASADGLYDIDSRTEEIT